MAFSKKRDADLLLEKGLLQIWEELKNGSCPYTEYIDFKYFSDTFFEESNVRYNILEWILLSICPSFEPMFEKKKSLKEQSQLIHKAAASLGFCTWKDSSLIKGFTTKRKQINFISFLLKLIPNKNGKHFSGSKYDFSSSSESFVAPSRSNVTGELLSIRGIMGKEVPSLQLFLPEIMTLLEKEKNCLDTPIFMNTSMSEFENQLSRLENEIDKQYDVLQLLKKDVPDFTVEESVQATTNMTALNEELETTSKPLLKMVNGIREWFKPSLESCSALGPLAEKLDIKLSEVISYFEQLKSFQLTYIEMMHIYRRFEKKVLLLDNDRGHKTKRRLLNTMLQEWIETIDASVQRLTQSVEKK